MGHHSLPDLIAQKQKHYGDVGFSWTFVFNLMAVLNLLHFLVGPTQPLCHLFLTDDLVFFIEEIDAICLELSLF